MLFLGHVTFIVLLVLAWKHSDLRTTSGDSAYQIFKWVNDAGLNVEAHRYSAVIPQLAVKAFKFFHADLRTLLLVASVAHVLVAYAVFLICLLLLKAPRAAMATALAAVLCTRLTFYGPVLEANYLLCFPFLFFAVLEQQGQAVIGAGRSLGLGLAAALTLLVHPLGWLILLFGTVFLGTIRHITTKATVWVSLCLVLGAALVRLSFPPTAYEQAQYAHLRNAFSDQGLGGTWGSWDFLVGHTFQLTTNYLPALVVFVLVVVAYAWRKHGLAAAVLAAGVIGFLALELVTFRAGDAAIMMDRAFLPVATLITLPTTYLLWAARGRWAVAASMALAFVLAVKLRDVSFGSRAPSEQLQRKVALLEDLRGQQVSKALISKSEIEEHGITYDWALPAGLLLISAQNGPEQAVWIVVPDAGKNPLTMDLDRMILPSDTSSFPNLDPHYFHLPDPHFVHFPL